MKRTYQPKKRQEQKEHGFMKRMKTDKEARQEGLGGEVLAYVW